MRGARRPSTSRAGRRAAAPVVVVVAVLAACSGGGHAALAPVPSTTSAPPTTTTPAPTTTVRPTTTVPPTTTTVALVPQATPDAAATTLLEDWEHHDRHGAEEVATPSAVTALFAQAPQAISDRGCQNPIANQSMCAFGLGVSNLVQLVTVSLAGGWVVQTVDLNP